MKRITKDILDERLYKQWYPLAVEKGNREGMTVISTPFWSMAAPHAKETMLKLAGYVLKKFKPKSK